jgi:tight adherence protein C
MEMIIQILLFVSACLATLIVWNVLVEVFQVRRRLMVSSSDGVQNRKSSFLGWFASNRSGLWAGPSLGREVKREQVQRDLEMLGIYSPNMTRTMLSARWVITIVAIVSMPFLSLSLGTLGVLISGVIIVCAFMLPEFLVKRIAAEKRERIRREYPNVIELLQLYLSSGTSLRLAIEGAASHGSRAFPILRGELLKVLQDINAGREQSKALDLLAYRTQSAELKSLASVLNSGETFGVGVSASLAVFALNQRQTRFLDAEGRAGRIPALITLPLLFCIMPAVLAVIILPTAISVIRSF